MDPSNNILIFGARSDVGSYLLPLLAQSGRSIYAFSRNRSTSTEKSPVTWIREADFQSGERHIANLLQQGEAWVHDKWSKTNGCTLIFRPTMIYGGEQNQNINRIKRVIKLTRFFVLPGRGTGLRQPVHAEDLAKLCCQCLDYQQHGIRTLCLTGGETLQYRTMIERISLSSGVQPKIISLPHYVLGVSAGIMRFLPIFKDMTSEMLTRVNQDLCYDHQEAVDMFNWSPRRFQP